MSRRLRSTIVISSIQYSALGLGCALGFALVYRVSVPSVVVARLLQPEVLGGVALLAFLVEMLRYRWSPRMRQAHPNTAMLCEALLLYAGWFYSGLCVIGRPSLEYDGSVDFIIKIHLLLPFLLAIGPLVRSAAWIGVVGVVVLFATVLSILIHNGFSPMGGIGFFSRWIA
jgi:hypothetical protein